jgi:HAD superfamily hydrolase (TIGR01509 family)
MDDDEVTGRMAAGQTLAAVLFDMDGTLVDTEPYWYASEFALVEKYGGTWSESHAASLVGNALIDSATYIRQHAGVPLEPAVIVERMLDDVVAATQRAVPWRPGARVLLEQLRHAHVPCALVTMSYARLADAVVSQLPQGTFAAVITGDAVARGKPHPEPYLAAAAALGVEPARCVAIEDSPTGVASAEAAGCPVLAVPHMVPIPPGDGRTLVPSLTLVDVEMLQRLAGAPTASGG